MLDMYATVTDKSLLVQIVKDAGKGLAASPDCGGFLGGLLPVWSCVDPCLPYNRAATITVPHGQPGKQSCKDGAFIFAALLRGRQWHA